MDEIETLPTLSTGKKEEGLSRNFSVGRREDGGGISAGNSTGGTASRLEPIGEHRELMLAICVDCGLAGFFHMLAQNVEHFGRIQRHGKIGDGEMGCT